MSSVALSPMLTKWPHIFEQSFQLNPNLVGPSFRALRFGLLHLLYLLSNITVNVSDGLLCTYTCTTPKMCVYVFCVRHIVCIDAQLTVTVSRLRRNYNERLVCNAVIADIYVPIVAATATNC